MKKFLNSKFYGCIYGLVYFWLGSALICGLPMAIMVMFSDTTLRGANLTETILIVVMTAMAGGPFLGVGSIIVLSLWHIRPSPWEFFRDSVWNPFMKKLPGWRGW